MEPIDGWESVMGKVPKGVSGKSLGNKDNSKRGRNLGGPPRKGCPFLIIMFLSVPIGVFTLGYCLAQYII
jgi:hypothetical protein